MCRAHQHLDPTLTQLRIHATIMLLLPLLAETAAASLRHLVHNLERDVLVWWAPVETDQRKVLGTWCMATQVAWLEFVF